jgi:hypothetical protein
MTPIFEITTGNIVQVNPRVRVCISPYSHENAAQVTFLLLLI